MDISTFRWILIIAGIALIAGLYLFGVRDKKRKPRASRKRVHAQRVRREPVLEPDGDSEESGDFDQDTRQTELAIGDPTDSSSRIEPHPGGGNRGWD